MTLEEYSYIPLGEPEQNSFQIRLVTLYPGLEEDDVIIDISHFQITNNANQICDFDILSYTWGSNANPKSITVLVNQVVGAAQDHGGKIRDQSSAQQRALSVQSNLFSALKHLRRSDCKKRIWIDAICINQNPKNAEEKAEKNWSVQRMHTIYSRAARAVIWLGPESEDSKTALHILQNLGAHFEYDQITYQVKSKGQKKLLDSNDYEAITSLLQRSWFERVWIRQEAFAASESSIIQCGSDSITVVHFRNAIQVLMVEPIQVPLRDNAGYKNRLALAHSVLKKAHPTILDFMNLIRASQCYLSHDKVYGNLGMISMSVQDDFVAGIRVDYDQSPEQVYLDFFLHYFKSKGHLRLLAQGGLCQNSTMKPSWLPDWTVVVPSLDLSLEAATSHTIASEAAYLGRGRLKVNGVIASKIRAAVILEKQGNDDVVMLPQLCAQLRDIMKDQLPSDCADSVLESVARGISSYLNAEMVPLEELELQRQDIIRFVKIIYREGNLETYVFCRHPDSISKDNYVGVGCVKTQVGDVVSAVLGVNNLFILRPTSENTTYQLVGPCFVHGMNWGESLLGPLPDDVEVIPRFVQEQGVYRPYYINVKTQESSFWDPRIKWEELEVPDGVAGIAVINSPDGEPLRRHPHIAYLRQHGVTITDIELI